MNKAVQEETETSLPEKKSKSKGKKKKMDEIEKTVQEMGILGDD
jgi:hypothetical protein